MREKPEQTLYSFFRVLVHRLIDRQLYHCTLQNHIIAPVLVVHSPSFPWFSVKTSPV